MLRQLFWTIAGCIVILTFLITLTEALPQTPRCRKMGLMAPNRYGTCHDAHGVMDGCCHKCTTCPPGEGTPLTETSCFATCLPCEDGFYNDKTGNRICTPCSDCERFHRKTLTPCTHYKDAACSACKDGYTNDVVTDRCYAKRVDKKTTRRPTGIMGERITEDESSYRMLRRDTNATQRPKEPESEATTEDGSGYGISPWGYIACGLVVCACVCAFVVFAVQRCKKGQSVCGTRRPNVSDDSEIKSVPRKDSTHSFDKDSSSPLLDSIHPGDNRKEADIDMEAYRKPSSADHPGTRAPCVMWFQQGIPHDDSGPNSAIVQTPFETNEDSTEVSGPNNPLHQERGQGIPHDDSGPNSATVQPPGETNEDSIEVSGPNNTLHQERGQGIPHDDSGPNSAIVQPPSEAHEDLTATAGPYSSPHQERGQGVPRNDNVSSPTIVQPPSNGNRNSTETAGLNSPPHQETNGGVTHSNTASVAPDVNSSSELRQTSNNIPAGGCHGPTCSVCGRLIRLPSEEINRDPGMICLPGRDDGQQGVQPITPATHCRCSARGQSQFRTEERDDTIGDGRPTQGGGTTSIQSLSQIPEAVLEELKNKVISDVPLEVRERVCHCLDGNYRDLTKGRVAFAIKMSIPEREARRADDTETIMLKLLTQRVCVYDVLRALDQIGRADAVHVIAEWLQGIEQS